MVEDNRKYRMTKVINQITNKEEIVDSILDTGALVTIISKDIADKLNLVFIGQYDLKHSNKQIEHTYQTYFNIFIRGHQFGTKAVVSNQIGNNFLIIASDFMEQYRMFLQFDVKKNDISIIPQKKHRRVFWDVP